MDQEQDEKRPVQQVDVVKQLKPPTASDRLEREDPHQAEDDNEEHARDPVAGRVSRLEERVVID